MSKRRIRSKIKPKVFHFLPGLITTAALCFGLLSTGLSVQIASFGSADPSGLVWKAAAFIAVAMVLDMLDGMVARAFGIENRFGDVYDSLSDTVCFGVAPALLVYSLFGSGFYGPVLNIGLIIYAVCVALRLARFNRQSLSAEKKSFMGLPSPMAAGLMISPVFVASELNLFPFPVTLGLFYAFAAPITGFFMVSGIRYRKAGFFSLGGFARGKRFDFLVTCSVLIAVVAINPAVSVAVVSALYFISGPVFLLLGSLKLPGSQKKMHAKIRQKSEEGQVSENQGGGGV